MGSIEPGISKFPRCAIAHLRSGPSDHPGMTKSRIAASLGASTKEELWLQHQLLHPPVQQFRHVEHVLRRAGHGVDPAELLELFTGLAEHPQHLALEAELVDAARPGV